MKKRKCKGQCKRKLSINNFLELSPITDLRYTTCIDCMLEENNIQLTNLFNTSNQMETTKRKLEKTTDFAKVENLLMTITLGKANGNKLSYRKIAKDFDININTLNTWKYDKMKNGVTIKEAFDFVNKEIRCPYVATNKKPIMDYYFVDTTEKELENRKLVEEKHQNPINMENQKEAITATEIQVTTSTLKVAEMKAMLDNLVVTILAKNERLKMQLDQIVKEENEIKEMQKDIDILKDYFDNLKEVSHYTFDDFLIEFDITLDKAAKIFAEQLCKTYTPDADLQFVTLEDNTTKYKYPIEVLKRVLAPYLTPETV